MAKKREHTLRNELTSEHVNQVVARNFKILRRRARMKQEFVGYLSGYPQQTIGAYESGKIELHASKLTTFAEIFDCQESDFFRGIDDSGSPKVAVLNKEVKEVRDFIASGEGIDLNVMISGLSEHRRKLIVGLVKGLANG